MGKVHGGAGWLGAIVLAGLLATPGLGQDKVRVVIVDGQNNHDWRSTTPFMKKALLASGRFAVDVSTNLNPKDQKGLPPGWQAIPFPPDLNKYDVVLTNYNGASWPKEFNAALDERLKKGQIGLVVIHAANNSFGNWKEYNLMIGMGWRGKDYGDRLKTDDVGKLIRVPKGEDQSTGHRYTGPFVITVRDPDHPITKGMPREWMHARDELYDNLRGPIENVHLLATGFSPPPRGTGAHEPMIFTIKYGEGRVFHTPMGHDLTGMHCIGFVATLERGTEWAATGRVTLPLPGNFPTADKVSPVPK